MLIPNTNKVLYLTSQHKIGGHREPDIMARDIIVEESLELLAHFSVKEIM